MGQEGEERKGGRKEGREGGRRENALGRWAQGGRDRKCIQDESYDRERRR
jgi:hypothetical protein